VDSLSEEILSVSPLAEKAGRLVHIPMNIEVKKTLEAWSKQMVGSNLLQLYSLGYTIQIVPNIINRKGMINHEFIITGTEELCYVGWRYGLRYCGHGSI